MKFSDYMNGLPNTKVVQIERIAKATQSTVVTVYRWINGSVEPPDFKKQIIAKELGESVEVLFPPIKK